jgi:hypothetical protein
MILGHLDILLYYLSYLIVLDHLSIRLHSRFDLVSVSLNQLTIFHNYIILQAILNALILIFIIFPFLLSLLSFFLALQFLTI